MLLALNPGHIANDDGFELASIEVPPPSRASVISRTFTIALRTMQRDGVGMLHSERDFPLPFQERIAGGVGRSLFVELDVSNFPRGLKAEDLLVEVALLHLARIDLWRSTHTKS